MHESTLVTSRTAAQVDAFMSTEDDDNEFPSLYTGIAGDGEFTSTGEVADLLGHSLLGLAPPAEGRPACLYS